MSLLPGASEQRRQACRPWSPRSPRLRPAPRDELPRAPALLGEARLPSRAPSPRRTRFSPSQQAGKPCSPRRLRAGGPQAPGAWRKPELPATSSKRRGGGRPSKLPRRPAVRIPEEKPLCTKPKASAPPPFLGLSSSCLRTALLCSHLRAG